MTVTSRLLCTGMVFLTFSGLANGQWVHMGLDCVRVNAFVTAGECLLVGTEGQGVFRSGDNGASWSPVNAGLMYPFVSCLAFNGTSGCSLPERRMKVCSIRQIGGLTGKRSTKG